MFATVSLLFILSLVSPPKDGNFRLASCVVERAIYKNGDDFDLSIFWEKHTDLQAEAVMDYSKDEMMHHRVESFAKKFNHGSFLVFTISFWNSSYDDSGKRVRLYNLGMFALWP
jgi:hypothetical protein